MKLRSKFIRTFCYKIVQAIQDLEDAKTCYKSAWLTIAKKIGASVTEGDLIFKLPGTGISSYRWNKTFNENSITPTCIPAGTMLT